MLPLEGASPAPRPHPCRLQSDPGAGGCCSSPCRKTPAKGEPLPVTRRWVREPRAAPARFCRAPFLLARGGPAMRRLWSKSGQWLRFGRDPPSRTTQPWVLPGSPCQPAPHLWGPARGPQSFDGAADLLSARRLSAELGRSGTSSSFGVRSDWARGARSCRHPCRAPAALVCGSSAPPLLFQSWVKGPFLPMARREGGNQEFTRLVTEFRHPFLKRHLRRVCVVTVQLAAELSWSRSPEGLLSVS